MGSLFTFTILNIMIVTITIVANTIIEKTDTNVATILYKYSS